MVFTEKIAIEEAITGRRALSFDDVLIEPGHADFLPKDVSLSTRFSKKVGLNIPLVSSPMDTVTEYRKGIIMAKLGGLGIIHKYLTIGDQVHFVNRVKFNFHREGYLRKPISVKGDRDIESILNEIKKMDYDFASFPVIDNSGRLIGILTGNDFKFCDDHTQTASQVMKDKPVTTDKEMSPEEAYQFMKQKKVSILPLVDEENRIIKVYTWKDVKSVHTGEARLYNTDSDGRLRVGAAIGVDDYERLEKLVDANVDVIVLDSSHGDSEGIIRTLKKAKDVYPSLEVVAGNIAGYDSAIRLLDAGADGLRVGIGGGSICTTRVVTGVGCPQLTAAYLCAKAAEAYKVPICADGGIRGSGDITKALAMGAESVMMGSMFAGTDESPGNVITYQGGLFKEYRGMGSAAAMSESPGARERYFQEDTSRPVSQGVESRVPYKGSTKELVNEIYLEGLRVAMGLSGSKDIAALRTKEFWEITASSVRESHPHDVMVTADERNYTWDGR
jgi:IMP dehydrogenase